MVWDVMKIQFLGEWFVGFEFHEVCCVCFGCVFVYGGKAVCWPKKRRKSLWVLYLKTNLLLICDLIWKNVGDLCYVVDILRLLCKDSVGFVCVLWFLNQGCFFVWKFLPLPLWFSICYMMEMLDKCGLENSTEIRFSNDEQI